MIVVKLTGGIGNQMFQYALGRVLSIKNNTELVFNIEAYKNKSSRLFNKNFAFRTYDLGVFNVSGRVAEKKEIPWIYRMHGTGKLMLMVDALTRRLFRHKGQELSFQKFNGNVLKFGPGAYLDGFFQSPKYFQEYEDVIRKDFTLKNSLSQDIKNLGEEIKGQNSLCVQVRRGDYVGNPAHEVVDNDYYKKALSLILEKTSVNKIYVFSDDIEWCRKNLSFEVPTMFVGDEYAGEKGEGHIFLMSLCNYFIIPNSTFGWWGAWLSIRDNKVVVCPKKWFPDVSINSDDLIPVDWIRI